MNNRSISSELFHVYDKWIQLLEEGVKISDILCERGLKNVAIWGMGSTAIHLCKQLCQSNVCVKFVVDESGDDFYVDVPIVSAIDADFYGIDIIIYTNPQENGELFEKIKNNYSCKIISISDLIYEDIER